jgi:diadenosine tetraphosphate (Ap4A) HIT family hydrolase
MSVDLHRAQAAIQRTVNADHVNIESLGNVVPHLHWHIIPRYRDDPRWGLPIWTNTFEEMPDTRLSTTERSELVNGLRRALELAAI